MALLSLSIGAAAQTVTPSVAEADLGRVVSAVSGTTTFTFAAATGSVTSSGGGLRLSSGAVRALVTLSCGSQGSCNNTNVTVTVGPTGSGSGRAGPLSKLTVAMGTAVLVTAPTGVDTLTFTVGPIGRNSSKTFYVGATVPIAGDESSLPSGLAQSWFEVTTLTTVTSSGTGAVSASVSRPLSLASTTPLSFGRVIPPVTGSGTVAVSATDGTRTTSGGARVLSSPAPSAAQFTVRGEGGQVVSISVPTSFQMSGPAPLTVSTTTNANATPMLSGGAGAEGTYSFGVGGSLPLSSSTPGGSYSGSFTVTASYN